MNEDKESNGWREYKRDILNQLKRLHERMDKTEKCSRDLSIQQAILITKVAAFGLAGGAAASVVANLVMQGQ